MQPRIYWFVACTAVIFIGCNAVASNEKEPSGKEKSSSYNSYTPDDIYLEDQDALEGSGRGGGEVRDDLESSGSGLGPDDEDGDDGEFSNNNIHRPVEQPPKPVEPKTPYIEDPHKTKDNSIQDLAPPNRIDNDIHDLDSGHSESDPIKDDDIETPYMNPKQEDRSGSFFAQPGVLAAVIGGAVVGLLCAILVVMFIVYRMRKKDEGSYALDEPRRSPATAAYPKAGAPHHNREFYA